MFHSACTYDDEPSILFSPRRKQHEGLFYERETITELCREVRDHIERIKINRGEEDIEDVFILLHFRPFPTVRPIYTIGNVASIYFNPENSTLNLSMESYTGEIEIASNTLNVKNNITLVDIMRVLNKMFETLLYMRLNHTGVGKMITTPDEIKEVSSCINTRCLECTRKTKLYAMDYDGKGKEKKTYVCLFCYDLLFVKVDDEDDDFIVPESLIDEFPWNKEYFIEHNPTYNDTRYIE